jgi:hypothetical protein
MKRCVLAFWDGDDGTGLRPRPLPVQTMHATCMHRATSLPKVRVRTDLARAVQLAEREEEQVIVACKDCTLRSTQVRTGPAPKPETLTPNP